MAPGLLGIYLVILYVEAIPTDPFEHLLVLLLIALCIACGAFGIVWSYQSFRAWQTRVQMYENGYILSIGFTVSTVAWEDVDLVWEKYSIDGHTEQPFSHEVQLRLNDRTIHRFDVWSIVDSDVVVLPREAMNHLRTKLERLQQTTKFNEALTQLRFGHTVELGPLQVSPQGLYYRDRFVAWNDLRWSHWNFNLAEGGMVCQLDLAGDEPLCLHTGRVPNLALLVVLLNYVFAVFPLRLERATGSHNIFASHEGGAVREEC